MLGGDDDEEELAELVAACSNQVEQPAMVDLPPVLDSPQGLPRPLRPGPQLTVELDPTVRALLDQNTQLMNLVRQQSQGGEPEKKRLRAEVSYTPGEPVMLFYEAYRLEDDGHDKIDTHLRQTLRPINVCPSTYYTKGAFSRVDRPILGSALYLEHIMPNNVNESTICKHYDRCAIQEIKNYLTKNSGVGREVKKSAKFFEVHENEFSMGIQTNWLQASDIFEVVDAGWNYLAVEFMVRNYSYTAIAIMRCLHEVRFFGGVCSGPKQQKLLIENYFNDCFKVAHEGGSSLSFKHVCIKLDLLEPFSMETTETK